MFYKLIDKLFDHPSVYYAEIISLIEGNTLFISQFYKQ